MYFVFCICTCSSILYLCFVFVPVPVFCILYLHSVFVFKSHYCLIGVTCTKSNTFSFQKCPGQKLSHSFSSSSSSSLPSLQSSSSSYSHHVNLETSSGQRPANPCWLHQCHHPRGLVIIISLSIIIIIIFNIIILIIIIIIIMIIIISLMLCSSLPYLVQVDHNACAVLHHHLQTGS